MTSPTPGHRRAAKQGAIAYLRSVSQSLQVAEHLPTDAVQHDIVWVIEAVEALRSDAADWREEVAGKRSHYSETAIWDAYAGFQALEDVLTLIADVLLDNATLDPDDIQLPNPKIG